jgi:hypothetical protein
MTASFDESGAENELEAPEVDMNFMNPEVRSIGIFVSTVALLMSVFSACWVYHNKESNAVKISRPDFLYLICLGSAMCTISIYPLSFDESHGFSTKQLSFCCMLNAWIFVIGYVVLYSGFFAKVRAE